MPASAPEATCQGAPTRVWTSAATAALTAVVMRVTLPVPKPAMRPMNNAVKAKSAPSRRSDSSASHCRGARVLTARDYVCLSVLAQRASCSILGAHDPLPRLHCALSGGSPSAGTNPGGFEVQAADVAELRRPGSMAIAPRDGGRSLSRSLCQTGKSSASRRAVVVFGIASKTLASQWVKKQS